MEVVNITRKHETPTAAKPKHVAPAGINEAVVHEISASKHEPEWMRQIRLDAFKEFTVWVFGHSYQLGKSQYSRNWVF